MKKNFVILAILCAMIAIPACKPKAGKIAYPSTVKGTQVDEYFGTQVADPYRWLEDDRSAETGEWVKAQNALTFDYLGKIPFRENLRRRLTDIYNYPRFSSPLRAGENYFFYKNDGLQNQSVIYIQKGLEGTPEVFIDPNAMSADGTVRINLVGFSPDFKYAALSRGEAGSDWSEIRVMDIASKTELPDVIKWVKFSGTAWLKDGFYYSGYEKPAPGRELTAKNEYQKIYFHKLGDSQDKDGIVFEDREHPLRYLSLDVSEDKRYAFLILSEGTSGNEIRWKDLAKKESGFEILVPGFANDAAPIDNIGDQFLVHTNLGAPNFRVVLIDPKNPSPDKWKDIIPEKSDVLNGAGTAGGRLFCNYLKDANTRIFQHEMDGSLVREIELPALGSAGGFSGWKDDTTIFYTFTSYTYPPTIYKFDIASGASEVFRKAEVKFNPGDYETRQVFYPSKDGTRVPMFLVHKKGLPLDGKNPVFLTAYGGFNISITPSFNPANIVLLEKDVVLAVPNLRGGGEYGESWHEAGMLLKKQNVFDDFIAAAEYLIREKITSRDRLAISGASNGGLLVGAVMTQRPELFQVALPAVGVMDMLRFHKFTVGWGWVVEYGSSDSEKDFGNLLGYSPLHNLKPGTCYPATLITTADHDDRVVPAHSFKFAATLQERQACANPVLIRIDTRSGHGSSNVSKNIELLADEYAFMFENMGIAPKE